MKLSFPLGYLEGRYGLEKALLLVRDAGFDAIDYDLCKLEREDSPFSQSGWESHAESVRKMADDAGIAINQTHAPFHFKADKWEDHGFVMDTFGRCLKISGILGAEVAVIHPLHHFVYEGREEEIFEKNMVYYSELIPFAREAGVKIGVENMWQNDVRRRIPSFDTCSTAEEFVRYIDTLNSEQIVACLDIGHVGMVPQKDEAWDLIRALGHDRLHSLHVHDNDYRGDLHMLPYTGKIDWEQVTRALGEIDYDGDFTYETSAAFLGRMDDEFLPVGLKYMADVGKHLIKLVERSRPQ